MKKSIKNRWAATLTGLSALAIVAGVSAMDLPDAEAENSNAPTFNGVSNRVGLNRLDNNRMEQNGLQLNSQGTGSMLSIIGTVAAVNGRLVIRN